MFVALSIISSISLLAFALMLGRFTLFTYVVTNGQIREIEFIED